MSRSSSPVRIAIANLAFDLSLASAEELLLRYETTTGHATSLRALGAEVTVLQRFHTDLDLVRDGVAFRLRADDPRKTFAGLRSRPTALFRLARELAPDVVHVNGLMFPAAVAELRAVLPRTTAIAVQHHAGGPGGGRLRLLQRALLRFADGFLFTAEGVADPWRRAGLIRPRQRVLEVSEASSTFVPAPRDEARRKITLTGEREGTGDAGDPAILWVGRLHERKDPLTAFRAVAAALPRLPGARLHAAFTEAPMLDDVRRLLEREPALAARTTLLGPVPHGELPAWYAAADLFLTSSPDEGSNYALIEALACGLPCVAADIPAHRALGGAETAFFPPGDVPAAVGALVAAAERARSEGDSLRAAVRRHFERELSWPAVARKALAAYGELVSLRRSRRGGERGVKSGVESGSGLS